MDRMARSVRAVLLMFGVLCALAGATARAQPGTPNYQGLWWAAPAGSQSGWGINLAHQGEVIFLTWFTYGNGSGNESLWMTMTASRAPDGTYSGTLVQTNGPSYSVVPFDSNAVTVKPFTADATLSFDSPTTGTVTYQASSSVVVQPITMQTFGPLPTCVWGAQPDLTKATNYTDLWWASPPGSESGWGVNLTHQGNIIFATWFTYAIQGSPAWMSVTAAQVAPNTYSGTLYKTAGPAWGSLPFDSSLVSFVDVGTATFAFTDGNNATFTYNVSSDGAGRSAFQIKAITRQVFRPPGTACQ